MLLHAPPRSSSSSTFLHAAPHLKFVCYQSKYNIDVCFLFSYCRKNYECPVCLENEDHILDGGFLECFASLPDVPLSSKLHALKEDLRNKPENSAVCCQYCLSVHLVRLLLQREDFKEVVGNRQVFEITGKLPQKKRMTILQQCLQCPHILVFSLKCGGVGWNLLNTVNMYLLEPHWNPQLEAQASDRVWRLHHYHTLVRAISINTNHSVDVRINKVKQEKLDKAEKVILGTYVMPASADSFHLTNAELMNQIFGYNEIDLTQE